MNPQIRKQFVIIVHYGPSSPTRNAFNSLYSVKPGPDKVIIIDNGETKLDLKSSDKLQIIRPEQNKGYAGGINLALGAFEAQNIAATDVVTVMNNDIVLEKNSFEAIRLWWMGKSGHAVLGATNKDQSNNYFNVGYVNLWTGRSDLRHKVSGQSDILLAKSFSRLPYIHGSLVSATYHSFMKAPGFEEKYFLYWEDALFGVKSNKNRIPMFTSPKVVVTQQPKSHSSNDNQLYYLVRNGALFLEQETPWPWRSYWYVYNRLRNIYHMINPSSDKTVKRALGDAIRGITGKRAV